MSGLASMTGFGRATRETADETFEVEVRAVNNRSLKVQPRISESASALAATDGVDGALVGGASLDSKSFLAIAENAVKGEASRKRLEKKRS